VALPQRLNTSLAGLCLPWLQSLALTGACSGLALLDVHRFEVLKALGSTELLLAGSIRPIKKHSHDSHSRPKALDGKHHGRAKRHSAQDSARAGVEASSGDNM
jgi:hypothetical protein